MAEQKDGKTAVESAASTAETKGSLTVEPKAALMAVKMVATKACL